MANCINTRCANTQPKRFFGKRVLNSLYLEPTDVYEVTDIISSLNPYTVNLRALMTFHLN